jgi:pyruvate dehydrogenase E2 component (dihydrolipoamide acetyltransferase)
MAEIIDMPKLSDTMSVGTLVKWNIKEGQGVAFGDILAEVETDKATMELSCTVPGTVLKIYAPAGTQLPVGAPICAIGKKGEAAPEPSAAPAPKAAAPATAVPAIPEKTDVSCIPAAPASSGSVAPQSDASRAKASPYAKRMAEKAALNVAALSGTGPGGRVVGRDVAAAASAPAVAAPSGPLNVAVAPPADGKGIQPDADVPVGGMRQTIARRLLESKVTVPHFYLEVEVDAAPLMAMRESLNKRLAEAGADAIKLSVNDFILKASAASPRSTPPGPARASAPMARCTSPSASPSKTAWSPRSSATRTPRP